MRRLLPPALVSLLALSLVGLLVFGVLKTTDSTSIDQAIANGEHPRAHDARLPLLDGGTRTLAELRGRVVIVNFFAHWCVPCQQEAPLLSRTQRLIERRGATLLGVAWDDTTADSRRFVHDFHVNYPVVRDVDGSFATAYGVKGMPESFVIDRRGHIVALRRGALDERWIAQHVDPLLTGHAS
jgi:cytochrome c biogenesis protein CcmG/thiol:disulfide interchange protein DsbE